MKTDEEIAQVEKKLKGDKEFAKQVFADLGMEAAPASGGDAGGPAAYTITVNGNAYHVDVAPAVAGAAPQITNVAPVAVAAPAPVAAAPVAAAGPGTEITAPMPGTVMKVLVEEGASVAEGDTVVVMEAMKMEQPIKAPCAGTVQSVEVSEGDTVDTGQVVAVI